MNVSDTLLLITQTPTIALLLYLVWKVHLTESRQMEILQRISRLEAKVNNGR